MKKTITTAIAVFVLTSVYAQEQGRISYPNKFQQFVYSVKSEDSAVYYMRMMAANEKMYGTVLTFLVHDSYAQAFNRKDDIEGRKYAKSILLKAYHDTSRVLTETLRPVYYLVQAQDLQNNIDELRSIVNNFIKTELTPAKLYSQRTGRYGLMIHQLIEKIPALSKEDNLLFEGIATQLSTENIQVVGTSTRPEMERRAWARNLLATIAYMRSLRATGAEQMDLLKKAYDLSPDLYDNGLKAYYAYDLSFIYPDKETSYKDEYLSKLVSSSGDKTKVLATLLEMTLIDPAYKKNLSDYYQSVNGGDFNRYWRDAVSRSAVTSAPVIDLMQMNKEKFSSKKLEGKWILVDFWGTWCGPCRAEHPAMQKFYDSTVKKNNDKLALFTVACRDEEEKVDRYMQEKKFSFPVAMSNGSIEDAFKVQSYPTKILITPNRNYIKVPFGVDWVQFVKAYMDL